MVWQRTAFIMILVVAAVPLWAEPRAERAGITLEQRSIDGSIFPEALYGSVEMRHHVNTYYDRDDFRTLQQPAMHARAKVGMTFRGGLIDAHATAGIIKGAETQKFYRRRGELEVDVYPWRSRYGQLIQYNLVQLPSDDDPFSREENISRQGLAYTLGAAPTLRWPAVAGGWELAAKAGVDVWTRLYSKTQYRGQAEDQEERDERFALQNPERNSNEEPEPRVEDTAQRYYSQYMLGAAVSPWFLPQFEFEPGVFYDVYLVPEYADPAPGEEYSRDYTYVSERNSFYRLRASLILSERTRLINDFYHYHEGFFASRRRGDARRFRNVARISYRL